MCCVCNLLCKIISLISSILTLVLIILLILWLTQVIGNRDGGSSTATNDYLRSAGEYKYSAIGASFT